MLKFEEIAKLTVDAIQETHKEEQKGDKDEEKTPKQKRNAKIREHVSDMIDNSSLHGFVYIFDKRHPVRRTIWFIITTVAFIYAMLKVYESTMNFLSYPFSTARMRIYVPQIDFPAVSFCNLNDMRFSVMNNTKVDDAILGVASMGDVSGEEYRRVTLGARHNLDEMLVDCNFNGMKCTAANFTEFNWKQGDRCFTFNSGKPTHKMLKIAGAGVKRSLELTINIQHYEYYRDGKEGGIHLILHGQDETPVKIRGPMISPGFTTYVQVEKKRILNLKSPYKTMCGSKKLKYFNGYSMHTCWLEQLTDHVEKYCHCKDFFMPGDIPICSLMQSMDCMWPRWEEFDKGKLFKCPLPCEIDSYNTRLSRAVFPSAKYASVLVQELKQLPHVSKIVANITDEVQFTRDNLLRLVIYYEDLSYELVQQKPSYGFLVYLGDIGGQIGLFIGAGVMSYFEFIDCFGLVLYTRFFERFSPPSKAV